MTFDLKLTFTGMILYGSSSQRLHVLMPRTPDTPCDGGTGPGCMEPHAARLTFDSAHGRPGSLALDDALTHVSLRQRRLELPRVGSAYVRGIPTVVADLPSPVRQEVLDGGANEDLDARVTVHGGQATWAHPGECWEYLGAVRRMSHQLEWTIGHVEDDELDLPLTDMAGLATAGAVPRLYPIDGRIELAVWHVPARDLPPDPVIPDPPADGTPNRAMAHLGILLEGGVFPAPLFRPGKCGPLPSGAPARGASSLSCTGGQAPVA